jgi:hypothetical protein
LFGWGRGMVVPLRGDDCRYAARTSDRTLGFEPSQFKTKKSPDKRGFPSFGWGRGMVVPLRGDDCRYAARTSDRTLGFEPSQFETKKSPDKRGFPSFGWGRGIDSRLRRSPFGRRCRPKPRCGFVEPGVLIQLSPAKKNGPRWGPLVFWLGERD